MAKFLFQTKKWLQYPAISNHSSPFQTRYSVVIILKHTLVSIVFISEGFLFLISSEYLI